MPQKGRTQGLLSRAESLRFLQRLRGFLHKTRCPSKDAARKLGCSVRTAQRLLNAKEGKIVNRRYVARFAEATGVSVASLCGPGRPSDSKTAMVGWRQKDDVRKARAAAGVLAQLVASRAFYEDLLADYTVTHRVDGRPSSVIVNLAPVGTDPNRRAMLIFCEDGDSGDMNIMDYVLPDGNVQLRCAPTKAYLHKIFTHVKSFKPKRNKTSG